MRKAYQISPYIQVLKWIKENDETIELTDDILSSINPIKFLEKNFSIYGQLTIFLNENFNNFKTYSLDKRDFLKYIKYCFSIYKNKRS